MAEQHGFVGQDHDQRFKVLIREFFADFMRLFFATWASRFDFTEIDWLDQELLPAPPDGVRLVADLVARLRVLEPVAMPDGKQAESWLAIVHIEIEAPDNPAGTAPARLLRPPARAASVARITHCYLSESWVGWGWNSGGDRAVLGN